MKSINPFQPSVALHKETSHLFCRPKQVIRFYMKRNTGVKWVKRESACVSYLNHMINKNEINNKPNKCILLRF